MSEKREDGEEKKGPLTPWVEVPPAANNPEKPSLMQRLRSIAEGGSVNVAPVGPVNPPFVPPMDERQGPPIVNLNNSGRFDSLNLKYVVGPGESESEVRMWSSGTGLE